MFRIPPFSWLRPVAIVATTTPPVLGATSETPPNLQGFHDAPDYRWSSLIHLDRMGEDEVADFLLRRSCVWNFRRLSLGLSEDAEEDGIEQLFHAAAVADIFASANRDKTSWRILRKSLRGLGCDAETVRLAEHYVPERIRSVAEWLDLGKAEERRRLACEFLEMALHSRQEIAVCLVLARRLATLSGRDWSGLLRDRREMRSDFEAELIRFVQEEGGVVPFERFYEHAMFNPRSGTYTGETAEHLIAPDLRGTPESFFATASHDPVLAKSIFSYARRLWEGLGRPGGFDLVEMGAGMGQLAEGILSLIAGLPESDGFRRAVRYRIIEKSPALARIQGERLSRFGVPREILCRSAVYGPLPRVANGLFFSNELVDMFPPRKVMNLGGRLFEAYVTYRGGLCQEVPGPVREETARFLEGRAIRLAPGETYYIQTDIDRWIETVDGALTRGALMTIDYGERRNRLREARHEFGRSMFRGYLRKNDPKCQLGVLSLATYRDSPTGVARPKDMTVDVDFTTVEEAAHGRGSLRPAGFLTQQDFLREMSGQEPRSRDFSNCRVSLLTKTP